jgi:hypothetical protein
MKHMRRPSASAAIQSYVSAMEKWFAPETDVAIVLLAGLLVLDELLRVVGEVRGERVDDRNAPW